MSIESPKRLKDDAQLGAAIRAAETTIAPERIASNGDAIKAAIAAGARTFSVWKVLLPILLVGGGFVAWRQLREAPARVASIEHVEPAPVIADAGVPIVDAETIVVVEADAAVVAAETPKPKRPVVEVVADAGVAVVEIDAAVVAPPASELPEQIRLYEAARAAGARGAYADGLANLDDLLQRFPQTPLRADAELTRAELLARANRLDEAAVALDALATSDAHRGRRAELLRTLGDVHRQRKDCKSAVDAYQRARSVTPSTAEKAKIDRGIEACTPTR